MTAQGALLGHQLRDVAAILETQADVLDHEFLDRGGRSLGLDDAWGRVRRVVGT